MALARPDASTSVLDRPAPVPAPSAPRQGSRPTFARSVLRELKPFHRRDNWHGPIAIAEDWVQVALVWAGLTALPASVPLPVTAALYGVGLLVVASRQRALEHLLHETSHSHLFRSRQLNTWFGLLLVAFPNFNSVVEYRNSHLVHHKDLGEDNDPDLVHYKRLGIDLLPVSRSRFLLYYVLWNGLRVPFFQLADHARRLLGLFDEPRAHRVARYAVLAALAVSITLLHGWVHALVLWLLPRFLLLPVIRYFGEMSKHGALIHNSEQMEMTRNRFPNVVERYITSSHNDHYHLVHHLWPGIPFYNLPSAHRVLMQDPAYRVAHHCGGYLPNALVEHVSITDELITDARRIK